MPPLYEYGCPRCGIFERYLPIEQYRDPQFCECGESAEKIISLPKIFVRQDIAYDSPIDGRHITSMQQRKEDLARSGCVEYDPEMKKDFTRRIEHEEKEMDKKFDETIEAEISKMPVRKLERLESEMKQGLTAEVERITPKF